MPNCTPQKKQASQRYSNSAAPSTDRNLGFIQSLSMISEVRDSILEETPEKRPTLDHDIYVQQCRPSNLATYGTTSARAYKSRPRIKNSGKVERKTQASQSSVDRSRSQIDSLFITSLQPVRCGCADQMSSQLSSGLSCLHAPPLNDSQTENQCLHNDSTTTIDMDQTMAAYQTSSAKKRTNQYTSATQEQTSAEYQCVILDQGSSEWGGDRQDGQGVYDSAVQPYLEFESFPSSSSQSVINLDCSKTNLQFELIGKPG